MNTDNFTDEDLEQLGVVLPNYCRSLCTKALYLAKNNLGEGTKEEFFSNTLAFCELLKLEASPLKTKEILASAFSVNHNGSEPNVFTFLAPGEPAESLEWRTTRINRTRWFSKQLWSHWLNIFEAKGYVEANLWLNQISERMKLGNTGLFIDADDAEIKDYAIAKTRLIALDTREAARRLDPKTAVLTIKTLFERTGIPFPLKDRFREDDYNLQKVVAAVARIEDPR